MAGHDLVIHLASNPDIAAAMTDPAIDFDEGTLLTHHVVEAMRRDRRRPRSLYASGSGVYGDLGEHEADEDHGPLVPVSTYGASKLAGEALICAYAHMFGLAGVAFRFGNVVGRRQTHGVGFDFVRRLLRGPDGAADPRRRQPEQVATSTSTTSSPPCWRGRPPSRGAVRGLQRRHRRLHHRERDRRARARGARASTRRRSRSSTAGGDRGLEGRRADRPPDHRPDPRASAGRRRPARAEALRRSMQRDARRRCAAGLR